jgi:Ca2+-binding EF-hand superfamily protein
VDAGVGVLIALPAMDAVNALSQAVSVPPMSAANAPSSPFSAVDTDNDGTATQAEVEQAVMASGGTSEAANALYTNLDPDGTGSVTANQFYTNMPMPAISYYDSFFGVTIDTGPPTDAQLGMQAVYQTMAAESDPVRQFTRGLFDKLDADADGALTKSEVEQSVVAAGSTAEAASALYTQLDPQDTGRVSEQQFMASLPRPDLTAEKARALSNALRPLPASGNMLAQSSSARTPGALSTSVMSVLLQAQSTNG